MTSQRHSRSQAEPIALPEPRLLFSALAGVVLLLWAAAGASAQQAEIKLAPGKVQFGGVAASKTRTVKIQNKGDAELVVDSIQPCAGTSDEFTFSPASATVASKKSANLDVTYAPLDEGSDEGCLEISSNDPQSPVVRLALAGFAADPDDDSDGDSDVDSEDEDSDVDSEDEDSDVDSDDDDEGLRLRPDSLDFGEVEIGDIKTLVFRIQTGSGTSIDVVLNRCFETSDEFAFTPTDIITVEPGRGSEVEVSYEPVDEGDDDGCLEVQTTAGGDPLLELALSGSGVEEATDDSAIDLDIHDFKVKKEVRLRQGQTAKIQLWVKNNGETHAPVPATVIGTQGEQTVYEETLTVSDRPGNEGVSKYTFPRFSPSDEGDVVWTAALDDEDSDEDTATAVTRVIGDSSSGFDGVDLDIRRFRVTSAIELDNGESIRLRLAVVNNGTVDEARTATLVGMQLDTEVYFETLAVSDAPGNRGASNYFFIPYVPDSPGEIVWMVVVEDDAPDVDEAFAVTRVRP